MKSPYTQFVSPGRMGIYEPVHRIGIWGENTAESTIITCNPSTPASIIVAEMKLDNQSEDTSQGILGPSNKYDQEASKPTDKVQRRLAQNREAARKSRLRKKAYVQQLESSRLKLMQLEQELEKTRQQAWRKISFCSFLLVCCSNDHNNILMSYFDSIEAFKTFLQGFFIGGGLDTGHLGLTGFINAGIMTFEVEYGHWLEEQNRQICDLRTALNADINDIKLQVLVENGLNHYSELFRMKAAAAKADVFYLMSGMWKSSAERFFLWIGGFRPSELLKVLLPQLDPLEEQQFMEFSNLTLSCQQAEDALSQGMDKLQQTLAELVAAGHLGESSYMPLMENAIERLENLVRFVQQVHTTSSHSLIMWFYFKFLVDLLSVLISMDHFMADHLRQETLQQMCRFLSTHQAARGLLVLGEYFQRLRALSSLWATRPHKPA